ncbi:Hypothetical predicted protein [Scomber scombrus]|uniref:Uncharacterized protein n=1 Tax=Scomber scombrus TaxID=13677 RepID=A0AAV1MTP1_SCOSC
MYPRRVTMVETVDVIKLARCGRDDGAKWMTVMQTDSECRQNTGTACNNDWNGFTDVPPPLHTGKQLLCLKVCDKGQVEQLNCPCRSNLSREGSTPASVSLKNAFSFSIVER